MQFASGDQIGKYRLTRELGRGGFGVVYVARDVDLERDVAIKFLLAEHAKTPQILQRFLQEARAAARIPHSAIVTVFECGQVPPAGTELDGLAYIAMELLHGETLSKRLSRGRMPIERALEITRQIASALEAAHQAGIVHRDLKPDNVFLVADPAAAFGERVKILDFGIAKLADGAESHGVHTHSMMVFGTPRYMSPEQCRSSSKIDSRSDVYALGCIVFEMICGIPPYDGEPGELIAKHQLSAVPSVRAHDPTLTPQVDTLVTSMLAKNADDRPASMASIEAMVATPGLAFSPSAGAGLSAGPSSSIVSSARRRRGRIAAIAAGMVVAGVATVLALSQGSPSPSTGRGPPAAAPGVPAAEATAVRSGAVAPAAPLPTPQPTIIPSAAPATLAGASPAAIQPEPTPSGTGGEEVAPAERRAATTSSKRVREAARKGDSSPPVEPPKPAPVAPPEPVPPAVVDPAPKPEPEPAPKPEPIKKPCSANDFNCVITGGH